MQSSNNSSVLPLFSRQRRPSATDSLQNNLDHDSDLSVRHFRQHVTWRESVGGIARTVLLKAKGSIDTMRGMPTSEEAYVSSADLPGRRLIIVDTDKTKSQVPHRKDPSPPFEGH